MTKKINHKQFSKLIQVYYKTKIPLIAYGTFGIGKSYSVKDASKELAKSKSKEFVEWNKLDTTTKDKVFKNLKDYFILFDERLSEYDTTDCKGLPDFSENKDFILWKIPFFAKILENKDSDGVLFFDELNLATPLVISSVYKIIYDRIVNNSKINDNWLIIGCGNNEDDRAYTHTLASPLRDRGGEVELLSPSADEWTEWAIKNEIDSRIIAFINFKPSVLHDVNFDNEQKFTTARGWERLNCLIKSVNNEKMLELICGSAIGEGIAREFLAFCKIKEQVNLDDIISNPSKLKELEELSLKYFIVTALAENYNPKKIKFETIVKISKVLDELHNPEFVAYLWKLLVKYSSRFIKEFSNAKLSDTPLLEKYSQFLINDE